MSLLGWMKKKAPAAPAPRLLDNAPSALAAIFLFDVPPVLDGAAADREIASRFGRYHRADTSKANLLHYFFPGYPVKFGAAVAHGQGMFVVEHEPALPVLSKQLQQQWHWADAAAALGRCQHVALCNDLLTASLPYKQRVEMFQKLVVSLASCTRPTAIYFTSSEKVVDTADYLARVTHEGMNTLYGLVNVRYYQSVKDGYSFMDTIGLHTLGLADLQVRFKDMDAAAMAERLYTLAHHIFNHESPIRDGDITEGIHDGQRTTIRFAVASLEPPRHVLNLIAEEKV